MTLKRKTEKLRGIRFRRTQKVGHMEVTLKCVAIVSLKREMRIIEVYWDETL